MGFFRVQCPVSSLLLLFRRALFKPEFGTSQTEFGSIGLRHGWKGGWVGITGSDACKRDKETQPNIRGCVKMLRNITQKGISTFQFNSSGISFDLCFHLTFSFE